MKSISSKILSTMNRDLEISMSDSTESIGFESVIRATYFKHQSKISLQYFSDENMFKGIYFSEEDQTLKIFNNFIKKYYFDIEFDSENNELLETTQFKIKVSK